MIILCNLNKLNEIYYIFIKVGVTLITKEKYIYKFKVYIIPGYKVEDEKKFWEKTSTRLNTYTLFQRQYKPIKT